MAWYPKAERKPLTRNFTKRKTNKNCVLYHTSASGSATSLYGFFSGANANASSHFHIDFNGNVEQYMDTDFVSWASGEGNSRSVSIETQGTGAEAWTPAQVKALVELTIWICKTHDIPVRQMASSKVGEAGIGWHRLGVNGNFPSLPSILAGRLQRGGGEKWSSATGKVCPGSKRIEQIPSIITQVKTGTSTVITPSKPETSKPVEKPVSKPKPQASAYAGDSIVEYLNSIKQPSSFSARKALATKHGIKNYSGTAAQNLKLLKILRGETTASKPVSKPKPQASGYRGDSIVEYLNSIKQPSSFTARKALAAKHGIKNYAGTAAQNLKLLKILRGF